MSLPCRDTVQVYNCQAWAKASSACDVFISGKDGGGFYYAPLEYPSLMVYGLQARHPKREIKRILGVPRKDDLKAISNRGRSRQISKETIKNQHVRG